MDLLQVIAADNSSAEAAHLANEGVEVITKVKLSYAF
jgi:hypothetical protein